MRSLACLFVFCCRMSSSCPMQLLSLHHVTAGYDRRPVLSDFSLVVSDRDFIVLRGKNGGGKTTLLKLLVGLLTPMEGRVERAPKLTLGYLPQYRSIDRRFPITVEETVRSGLQSSLRWWQRFGSSHRATTLRQLEKLNLLHLARRPIHTLSGGQWQRTLLARALVSSPQLLLLDEPDTHLDVQAKGELYAALLREHQSRAIVIVSHDKTIPLPPEARIVEVG